MLIFLDLFEGDILLDPKTNAIVNGQAAFDAVASEARKWPDAKIPYTYDSNVGKLMILL